MIWDFVSTFAMSFSFACRAGGDALRPRYRGKTLKTKIARRNKKQQKSREKLSDAGDGDFAEASWKSFSCTSPANHVTEKRHARRCAGAVPQMGGRQASVAAAHSGSRTRAYRDLLRAVRRWWRRLLRPGRGEPLFARGARRRQSGAGELLRHHARRRGWRDRRAAQAPQREGRLLQSPGQGSAAPLARGARGARHLSQSLRLQRPLPREQ